MNFLVLIFTLFLGLAHAYDVPEECTECLQKQPEILSKLTEPFSRLMYLEKKAETLVKAHDYLIKDVMPMARTLREGKSSDEIKEIKKDFDRLTLLQKEVLIKKKQFDICLFNCGPVMKMEIQDKIAALQKVKATLLIKRPILANKVFEERLSNLKDVDLENENVFPDKVFEADLKEAAFDLAGALDKRRSAYQKFLDDGRKPIIRTGNEKYTADYLDGIASRFPELIEDSLNVTFSSGPSVAERNSACFFSQQFKSYSDNKRRAEIAIDVGLVVVPLLAGPIGFEAAMAARIAGWGLKAAEFKRIQTAASFALQGGIIAKDRLALSKLKNECTNKEVRLFIEGSQNVLNELRACNEKYGEQLFMANLSLLPTGYTLLKSISVRGPPALTLVSKNSTNSKDISRDIYNNGLKAPTVEFTTPEKGVFTVMNLGAAKNPAVKQISEDYWRYVGNVYNERLNLTPKEIDNFIKSSMEMSPRTTLILNTEKSAFAGEMKIKGGVGIVSAKNSGELLPLEKATGVRIQKKPNEKIAEIVRLTVGKENDAVELSSSLIEQATAVLVKDKEVNRVFIFTSKIHGRLYRRMGVPADKIKTLDDRDVLIELDRAEVEKFAKSKIMN